MLLAAGKEFSVYLLKDVTKVKMVAAFCTCASAAGSYKDEDGQSYEQQFQDLLMLKD